MTPSIPSPDALPLPAPVWLFQVLLLLTFLAHLVPMNLLFGGSILSAISHGLSGKDERHRHLARRIATLMPTAVAMTVTLGVAPLLFVQVLYGHLLYSSSILMAKVWFSVIVVVILGYYGAYLLRFRWDRWPRARVPLSWALALLFAAVGLIYSNNFTLLQRPDTWAKRYLADPTGGQMAWFDPTLYPRYLHILLGAVAVAGVWIMLIGIRGRSGDAEWSKWAVGYGKKIFVHTTLLNIVVGFWFLLSLPRRVMMGFMGGRPLASGAFVVALLLIVVTLGLLVKGAREKSTRGVFGGVGALLALLGSMAVMRQEVRAAYLEPYFTLEELQAKPQWAVLGLFVICLVVGLAVVAWLVRVALRPRSSRDPAAGAAR